MKKIVSILLLFTMILGNFTFVNAVGSVYEIEGELSKEVYLPGEEVVISGKVLENNAGYFYTPVFIKIWYEDESSQPIFAGEPYTDENGEFTWSIKLDDSADEGKYTVELETSQSIGASLTLEFNVSTNANETSLLAQLSKETYLPGEEVVISGKVMKDGEGYFYTPVYIKIWYEDESSQPIFAGEPYTDENGEFTWSIKLDDSADEGKYTVELETSQSLGLSKTLEFNVTTNTTINESSLLVDKSVYQQGETVKISGTVYYDNEAMSYADVPIKIYKADRSSQNSEFVANVMSDENGNFSSEWQLDSNQELGDYIVEATIVGDVLNTEFEVVQLIIAPPTLVADTTDNIVGESVDITFADDEEWREAITEITVDGTSIDGKYTVSEGNINIEASVFTEVKSYEIVVKADRYEDATVTQVQKSGNESTLVVDKSTYEQGEIVKISGTVNYNDEAKPYVDVPIKIYMSDRSPENSVFVKNVTSDENGNFSCEWQIRLDQEIGDYTVEATILGDVINTEFTVEELVIIAPPTLVADTTDNAVGESVDITFADDEEWREAITEITVDGILVDGKYTVSEGNINIEASVFTEAKSYEIVVKAEGYEDATVTQVQGSGNESTLVVDKATYEQGEIVKISGTVYYNNETKPYANVPIKIYMSDESPQNSVFVKNVIADENGNFSSEWKIRLDQETGEYTVEANVLGDVLNTEFTVKEKATNPDPDPDPDPDPQPQPDPEEEEETETKTVDEDGGEVELLEEEVVLEIEEGTFDSDTNITVNVVNEEEVKLPENTDTTKLKVAGKVYEFDAEGKEFNKAIKVTLKYDKENVTDTSKLGIYYYNEEQEVWEFIGGIVDETNETITVYLEHFSKYAVMEFDKTFEDLESVPWAKNEIEVLAARHIINGMDENNYAPNANITRAQFAKLLVYALNLKAGENEVKFNDVEEGKWYTEPVEIAASLEIVKGYNGNFNPNGQITREAMAVMIVRALKLVEPDGDYTSSDLSFEDEDEISEWAKIEVGIAASKGLVKGMSETTFVPKANATRAQAAVIIYRLLDLLDRI